MMEHIANSDHWLSHWLLIHIWSTTVIATLFICIVYRVEIHPRVFRRFPSLPTAKGGYPFLGHGLAQFFSPRGEAYFEMAKSIPNDGLIHFYGFMNADHLLLTSSEAHSEVLVRRAYAFVKPPVARRLLSKLLGNSLLIVEGDEHRFLRKRIQPAFSFRNIRDLFPLFWVKAIDMVQAIEQSVDQGAEKPMVVDAWAWGNKATLDAIGLAALGKDFNTLRKPNELVKLYETITSAKGSVKLVFLANAFLPSWCIQLLPRSFNRGLSDAHDRLRRLCSEFVAERKNDASESNSRKEILLQLIQGNALSDDQLIDQLLTIIGAGYEPTSAAFTWTLWFLASHPSWQDRLRTEIRLHIPNRFFLHDAAAFTTSTTLEGLPVLNAICNETLRLMPTSPITSRVARDSTTVLGHDIPAGTRLFIVPAAINRLEASYGPMANSFDPSRWIDDSGRPNNHGGSKTNYAFLTFLHGPRKCIGASYAKEKVRAFVAAFVGTFEFEMAVPGEVPRPAGITAVKPRDGLKLRLKKVDAW